MDYTKLKTGLMFLTMTNLLACGTHKMGMNRNQVPNNPGKLECTKTTITVERTGPSRSKGAEDAKSTGDGSTKKVYTTFADCGSSGCPTSKKGKN